MALIDEVIRLREESSKQELAYKKAIENTNNLINARIASYNVLADKVLLVEQGRIATVQTLLTKHLKQFERLAKSSYEKAIQANIAITKINSQEDVYILRMHRKEEGINKLFVPMQFIRYDSE